MDIQEEQQQEEIYLSEFDKINKEFIEKIDGIRETFPLVMIFTHSNYLKTNSDLNDFVQKNGIEEKVENGNTFYKFNEENAHKLEILEKNEKIAKISIDIIPNSLFVSLISQFDAFLGKLIKQIFLTKPEILNSSEKSISFSKLSELKSFDETKEFMIEKEIESVLRESHTEHFLWLENKLKITLRKDLEIWKTFIEITERRNLLVHNEGIVTSQYLLICRQNDIFTESEPKIGDELDVSAEYFSHAFKCLYELSVKLTQVVWRKLLPQDIQKADESLNDICYELLRKNHNNLAIILLNFATNVLKKHFNEETKNVFIINLALANKLKGNTEKCREITNQKDWSACSDKFKIARAALLDDFEEVETLMKKIGKTGEIDKLSYKTWPLFNDFRKQDNFSTIFEEVFEEKYSIFDLPKSMIEEIEAKLDEAKIKSENEKSEISKNV